MEHAPALLVSLAMANMVQQNLYFVSVACKGDQHLTNWANPPPVQPKSQHHKFSKYHLSNII